MPDPTINALASAMDASVKVASSPGLMTIVDRAFGFRLSEWKAQGDVIRQQISDGYKEAQEKGLGMQYATAFREKANVLNTLARASEYVNAGFVREIALEEDVFWNLLDHSKTISNDDVQDLIARIIAGEYNQPGTYSMSTLQVLKSLGKSELSLLEKSGCLLVNADQVPVNAFQFGPNYREFLKKIGITYSEFQMLQSLGLFYGGSATREIDNPEKKKLTVNYFDKVLVFKPEGEDVLKIKLPDFYGLTPVGKQILAHLNPTVNAEYYAWLKENYKVRNYSLEAST
jgi:Protein of unknown function (DUF2806)